MDHRTFDPVYESTILQSDFFEGEDYYVHFRDRYFNTLKYLEGCLGSGRRKILDVGSGQFAVLAKHLFGVEADVVDIDTRFTKVLADNGVGFRQADLSKESLDVEEEYDVVVLAEVIEHVPRPPYLVFEALHRVLRPEGFLLVTTPNLYRLRNVYRLLTGRCIFDYFLVPEKDGPLGHFIEYSRDQIEFQLRKAGFEIHLSELVQLSLGGASRFARVARRGTSPLLAVRPLLRDNIVAIGRKTKMNGG